MSRRLSVLPLLPILMIAAGPDQGRQTRDMFSKSERGIREAVAKLDEAESKKWKEAIAAAERGTVRVIAPPFPSGARGSMDLNASGFIVGEGKYLVGAGHSWHQIHSFFKSVGMKAPETVRFLLPSGKCYSAVILKWSYDPKNPFGKTEDYFVARIENPSNDPLPSVELAAKVEAADAVVIAGYPLSNGKRRDGTIVSAGQSPKDLTALLCSGKVDKTSDNLLWINLDHSVHLVPGNSGGPMFNLEGKAIGVTTYSGKGWGGGTQSAVIRRALDEARPSENPPAKKPAEYLQK